MIDMPAQEDRATSSAAHEDASVLVATRELLWVETPADAREAAVGLVEALGGTVVPADQADDSALPVDVSFGEDGPLLPSAPPMSITHMLLSRHLPGFVRDAHRAVELAERTQRLAEDAEVDQLTGLPNRRVLGRALGRLRTDDAVIMLDLDHFKALNDDFGHAEGDGILRSFGRVIADATRARDLAGRYGGEEFVIVLSATEGVPDADGFLRRLRADWERARPQPVTFSAGIATVGADPSATFQRADAAMYAAKRAGRDRWTWAGVDATTRSDRATAVAEEPPTGFVAYSLLEVPEDGRAALIDSFTDRLRLVDRWPGFRHLEVWADRADPTSFVMVSWWDREEDFRAYMGSDDHRRSHERIPGGPSRPRPDSFHRYEVIAR
ncbi:MAG: diguanylate cyclase [Nitriliruptoraceae bacterium]